MFSFNTVNLHIIIQPVNLEPILGQNLAIFVAQ